MNHRLCGRIMERQELSPRDPAETLGPALTHGLRSDNVEQRYVPLPLNKSSCSSLSGGRPASPMAWAHSMDNMEVLDKVYSKLRGTNMRELRRDLRQNGMD